MGKKQRVRDSTGAKIRNIFTKIDFLGETIGFEVKGGNSYKSVLGAILSLGIATVVLVYGSNKYKVMHEYGGTDYQTITNARGLDNTKNFSYNETRTNIMFGLYEIDTGRTMLEEDYHGYFEW